jgi:hypothetical protein
LERELNTVLDENNVCGLSFFFIDKQEQKKLLILANT